FPISCTQFLIPDEVRVQSSSPDFIATGLGNAGFSKTRQNRTQQHYRSAQGGCLATVFFSLQKINVDLFCCKAIRAFVKFFNLATQITNQLNKFVDIPYIRNRSEELRLG